MDARLSGFLLENDDDEVALILLDPAPSENILAALVVGPAAPLAEAPFTIPKNITIDLFQLTNSIEKEPFESSERSLILTSPNLCKLTMSATARVSMNFATISIQSRMFPIVLACPSAGRSDSALRAAVAVFELLPATARPGGVAAHFGTGRPVPRAWCGIHIHDLVCVTALPNQISHDPHRPVGMGEEQLVASAQIVEPRLAVGCRDELPSRDRGIFFLGIGDLCFTRYVKLKPNKNILRETFSGMGRNENLLRGKRVVRGKESWKPSDLTSL